MDNPNGIYYLRNRYYSPGLGRFLSRDPSGIAGGVNIYAYTGDDPVDFSDPTGLQDVPPAPGQNPTPCPGCFGGDPGGYQGGGIGWPGNTPKRSQGGLNSDIPGFYGGQNGGGLRNPLILAQEDEDEDDNPLAPEGRAEQYILEHHLTFVADRIAHGHAFAKHILEFSGISTRAEFAAEIDRILTTPSSSKALSRGRAAFWDATSGTVVIYDPNSPDLGQRLSQLRAYNISTDSNNQYNRF